MHRYLLSSFVADAATAHPERVAVVCGDDTLTWQALDRRVGQLAATLQAIGVDRGDRVGIYLHKSIESMVAVHGILRSGAAYVPIDPLAPIDLVASIVADCGIKVLVTHTPRQAGLVKLLPNTDLDAVIGVEADLFDPPAGGTSSPDVTISCISWDEVATNDGVPPFANVDEDLAYVMYTSGSTGKPKGIMHTHRSGFAYAAMAADLYGLGPEDRTANFSPLHFDMSTFEILAAPRNQATTVLIPEPYLRVPASLTQYLSDHQVTTMYTVPSLFMQMMSRGGFDQRDWGAVRWVMPAGEVFPPEPLRRLMAMVPNARFSNVYGPAEVNQCTYYHLPGPLDDVMPLGQASPGAELDLIDGSDASIEGVGTGELIVRTSTMMAGYWNRPDLDVTAFLYRNGPGGLQQRWHRTGDVVRRDETGQLVFLGRQDNQVKVRGNRVELEVVEAAVGSLPGVEQAVAGPRPDGDGEVVLVARYVVNSGWGKTAEPPLGEWRSTLVGVLPGYAVPTVFEEADAFPVTPSGKIDRRRAREAIASGEP